MKIESSEVTTSASTDFSIEQKSTSSFTSQLIEKKLDIKESIRKQNMVKVETTKLEKVLLTNESNLCHQDKIKKNILEILLQNFTDDKDFKLLPKELKNNDVSNELYVIKESTFNYKKEYTQESSINFDTQAQIKTNRGQINVDLNLSFSQSFYEVHEKTITSKKTIYLDPLIINYKGELNSFDNIDSKMKFEFDLNSNGKNDLIPQLKDGTGFLALDKNQNGTIDNGNELFGANTGDGFGELKQFDKDNNSWIDENDSIFDSLLIWEKNEQNEGSLITLGQAGIGAIYLSAADSVFTYSSGVKEEYAKLKQSSFYLKEDGKAGLVTSVDFAT